MKFTYFHMKTWFSNIDFGRCEKNPKFFLSKSPVFFKKRCRIELEAVKNQSDPKNLFSLQSYMHYSISAECLKPKSANFTFWLLTKYYIKFFWIRKLFSYVFRSFWIRFWHQKIFPVEFEILKYIFSLKNCIDFRIFAEPKFRFHRKFFLFLPKDAEWSIYM